MTRSRKNNLIIIFSFLYISISAQEINLFDDKNTFEFAKYLFQAGHYNYAAQEYERLFFKFPCNEEYQLGLLKSYRFAGDYSNGISSFQKIASPAPAVQQEYIRLNLLSGNITNLNSYASQLNRESILWNNLDLTLRLISIADNPPGLDGIQIQKVDEGLMKLYYNASDIKHKSPFLAGTMSTFIPGTGKVYSGRWKDGLMSVLFIGATAFQSYRGFDKKGVNSVYGWIMGGLSIGFYLGNIYGSVKAAKLYNSHQHKMYVEEVTHYYIDHF